MTQRIDQTFADETERFEDVVLPHLGAAYGFARGMMRNEQDAEDAVQEAALRAFRYFRTFTGGNARAWFLTIVRNTCCDRRRACFEGQTDPFDEELIAADARDSQSWNKCAVDGVSDDEVERV